MKTITLFTLLFITINCGRTVYMCHDDPFKDEQCMKKETLGSNDFVWVRKCKGAKVCVDLPYYNGIIGACSIKVRPHYDGESCANGNKCGSGICDGTKCKGLNPDVECVPGLGQCKKGYLCRKSAKADGTVNSASAYTCQKPIGNGKPCNDFSSSSDDYKDYSNTDELYENHPNLVYYISDPAFFNPGYNPCGKDDVCSSSDGTAANAKCVKIGSVTSGSATNPLACSTGYLEGTTCKAGPSSGTDTGLKSSRGASFTKYSNISEEFKAWKEEWDKKTIKDDDFIYEAYRYTKNKKKINEAFFRYIHAPFIGDADECAYDYLWKQNSSNSIKFSLMILVLALLF